MFLEHFNSLSPFLPKETKFCLSFLKKSQCFHGLGFKITLFSRSILKFYFRLGFDVFDLACLNGYFDLVVYLRSKNIPWTEHSMEQAVISGNVELVRYFIDTKVAYGLPALKAAVEHKRIKIIKILGISWKVNEDIKELIVQKGDLEVVKYFVHQDQDFHEYFYVFIGSGNLPVVRYLVRTEKLWTNEIERKTRDYLRKNTEPWEKESKENARNILDYIAKSKLRYDIGKKKHVTKEGNITEILCFLRRNGFTNYPDACDYAVKNVEILKYLHENGFPLTDKTLANAVNFGSQESVEYIHEKMGK